MSELTSRLFVAATMSAKPECMSSGVKGLVILWAMFGKSCENLGLTAEIFAPQRKRVSALREAMCPPPTTSTCFPNRSIIIGKYGGLVIMAVLSVRVCYHIYTP